ncbi:hypothetical protein GIB67_030818 [Kingdonia uniflora]|uniref:Uncharacterized protein n=1 Tax=Kingdonia uniflora TaxID=39325 RepID=A0A7J7L3C3_9MAGN|nr:hypothetical protein GIB67_030818 [Kingdonia uniflora]
MDNVLCDEVLEEIIRRLPPSSSFAASVLCEALESFLLYDGGRRDDLQKFISHNRTKSTLKRLDLRLPLDLDNDHLSAISRYFTGLLSLRLHGLQGCQRITKSALLSMCQNCKLLESAGMKQCSGIDEKGVEVLQNSPRLRRIEVEESKLSDVAKMLRLLGARSTPPAITGEFLTVIHCSLHFTEFEDNMRNENDKKKKKTLSVTQETRNTSVNNAQKEFEITTTIPYVGIFVKRDNNLQTEEITLTHQQTSIIVHKTPSKRSLAQRARREKERQIAMIHAIINNTYSNTNVGINEDNSFMVASSKRALAQRARREREKRNKTATFHLQAIKQYLSQCIFQWGHIKYSRCQEAGNETNAPYAYLMNNVNNHWNTLDNAGENYDDCGVPPSEILGIDETSNTTTRLRNPIVET